MNYNDYNNMNYNAAYQQPMYVNQQYCNPPINPVALSGDAPRVSILNDEERAILKNAKTESFAITPEESARNMCDHKDENGVWKVVKNTSGVGGTFICKGKDGCDDSFDLITDPEEINTVIKNLHSAWNSLKLLNTGNIPTPILRDLGNAVLIVEKILPKARDIVIGGWNQYMAAKEAIPCGNYNMPYGGGNMVNNAMAVSNNTYAYNQVPPVPNVYQPGYNPNAYYQQPQPGYNPNAYYQQTQPGYNPNAYYQQPQPGYNPNPFNSAAPAANTQTAVSQPTQTVQNITNNPVIPEANNGAPAIPPVPAAAPIAK